MTCEELVELLNRLADQRCWPSSTGGAGWLSLLDPQEAQACRRHCAGCEPCRRRVRGFERMGQALRLVEPPRPSRLLVDRLADLAAAERPGRVRSVRLGIGFGAAAAAFLIAWGLVDRAGWNLFDRHRPMAHRSPAEWRSLSLALSQVSIETRAMARRASWPGARLAASPAEPVGGVSEDGEAERGLLPSLAGFTPDAAAMTGVLARVGDRLFDGMRPLTSSARRGFQTLVEPTRRPPLPQTPRTDSRGA